MVPMRFVAETFGENVGWDAKNEMAYIGNNRRKYLKKRS